MTKRMMSSLIKKFRGNIKAIVALIVFLFILAYTIFAARGIIQNPKITITSPENGTLTYVPVIRIRGKVTPVTYLRIDGKDIPLHENNTFSNATVLKEGYNVIVLEAGDRFGRTTQETLEFMHIREEIIKPNQDNNAQEEGDQQEEGTE